VWTKRRNICPKGNPFYNIYYWLAEENEEH
jgi:hypothetical protein